MLILVFIIIRQNFFPVSFSIRKNHLKFPYDRVPDYPLEDPTPPGQQTSRMRIKRSHN